MEKLIIIPLLAFILAGCTAIGQANDAGRAKLTIAKVQKELKIGMPAAEVASVLGSPDRVSADETGREVWVYDKVITDHIAFATKSRLFPVFSAGSPHFNDASKTRKTLSLTILFDENKQVRDISYRR